MKRPAAGVFRRQYWRGKAHQHLVVQLRLFQRHSCAFTAALKQQWMLFFQVSTHPVEINIAVDFDYLEACSLFLLV